MQPWFQNGTCDPFHPESSICTLGNLVEYSVNASSAADVVAGLKFAREKNLRLAIKNTGHEYAIFPLLRRTIRSDFKTLASLERILQSTASEYGHTT